jgi:steroid delta-isomerase-like uncharacterized protein
MLVCTSEARKERSQLGEMNMNVEDVGRRWVAGWNSKDSVAFSMLFAPDGVYIDPAFGRLARGRDLVRKHHKTWWNAIPDFQMTAEHIHVADNAIIVQAVGQGTFSGRDLGEIMKATSKPFRGRIVAVLELNSTGEITSCTEYYDRAIIPGGEKPPLDDLTST